jgi:hypothetical protein
MTHSRYTSLNEWRWRKEIIMETLFIVIMLFIVLDIASLLWGFDSTEKIDSPEWERRTAWHASHGKSARIKRPMRER